MIRVLKIHSKQKCPACNSEKLKRLFIPTNQCMRSDGLILNEQLTKIHCSSCSLLYSKIRNPKNKYLRTNGTSTFEIKRHANIAEGLSKVFKNYTIKKNPSILEVGAGNFQTSLKIKEINPNYKITALENSPELKIKTEHISIINKNFLSCNIEDKFDILFSNHVIEHFLEPVKFLAKAKELIKKNGLIIACCPTYLHISDEILFSDHHYHFTKKSIALLAHKAGLFLLSDFLSSWDKYSHVYIFSINSHNSVSEYKFTKDHSDLLRKRKKIFSFWSQIDYRLCQTLKKNINLSIFGAGEYTQIIKAYMPKTWLKIKKIIVDDINGIRKFDKKVYKLIDIEFSDDDYILIGAQKKSHPIIIKKLLRHNVNRKNLIILTK